MRFASFSLLALAVLFFVGFAFAGGETIASSADLVKSSDRLVFDTLQIIPVAELNGKQEVLERESKSLEVGAYSVINDITLVKEGVWKFGLGITKDTSNPSGLGWSFESPDLVIEDWNVKTTKVFFKSFYIDFQDVIDSGLGLKFVKTKEGITVYAIGDFKGGFVFIDPTLVAIAVGDIVKSYKPFVNREPKFVLRSPDNNNVYAFFKNGHLYNVSSTQVVTDVTLGTQTWVNVEQAGTFLTQTVGNKLIMIYYNANQPADNFLVGTCNKNVFACNNANQWGVSTGVIPYNGGVLAMDSNGTHLFHLRYTGIPAICNSTTTDCNASANWSALPDAVLASDPAGISAGGKALWAINQAGLIKVYDGNAGTWNAATNPTGWLDGNYAMNTDNNGTLVYAVKKANTLVVEEYVMNPASKRRTETISVVNDSNVTITIYDGNAFIFFTKNQTELYYITKNLNDANYTAPRFIQGNIQYPSSSKVGFNKYIDYTFWNPITANIDSNFFKTVYSAPPSIVTADFNYVFRNGVNALDPEFGINSVIVDFNDTSYDSNSTVIDWNWFVNGVLFSTDANTSRTFTVLGDYNIMLRINDLDHNDSNTTKTVSVKQAIQALSISLDGNSISSSDLNIQFDLNSTFTGSASAYWWQLNGAYVGTTKGIHQLLTTNGDNNYCITAKTTGTDYNKTTCTNYFVTQVKVKKPLNEQDLNIIIPFNISIDSNSTTSYSNISTDVNIWFIWNSVLNKNVYINDFIGEYFGRYYGVIANGTLQTLQPYLIKKTIGGNVKISVKELSTSIPLINAKVTLKKIVGGTMTVMEQQYSDATGATNFIMIYNDTYYLDANYLSYGFQNYVIKATESTYVVFIDTLGGIITVQYNYGIDSNYLPSGLSIDLNNATFLNDLNSSVFSSAGKYLVWARLRIYMDSNVFLDVNTDGAVTPFQFVNAGKSKIHAGGLTAGHNIVFDWNVKDVNGHYYTIKHTITYGSDNLTTGISNLAVDFGQTGSTFIAIFLTIIICGLAVFNGFGNAPGISILGGLMILTFSFLGFIPWGLAIIACIGGFGLYYLQVRQ